MDLPVSLQSRILGFLDMPTLAQVSSVCPLWEKISDNLADWKEMCLREIPQNAIIEMANSEMLNEETSCKNNNIVDKRGNALPFDNLSNLTVNLCLSETDTEVNSLTSKLAAAGSASRTDLLSEDGRDFWRELYKQWNNCVIPTGPPKSVIPICLRYEPVQRKFKSKHKTAAAKSIKRQNVLVSSVRISGDYVILGCSNCRILIFDGQTGQRLRSLASTLQFKCMELIDIHEQGFYTLEKGSAQYLCHSGILAQFGSAVHLIKLAVQRVTDLDQCSLWNVENVEVAEKGLSVFRTCYAVLEQSVDGRIRTWKTNRNIQYKKIEVAPVANFKQPGACAIKLRKDDVLVLCLDRTMVTWSIEESNVQRMKKVEYHYLSVVPSICHRGAWVTAVECDSNEVPSVLKLQWDRDESTCFGTACNNKGRAESSPSSFIPSKVPLLWGLPDDSEPVVVTCLTAMHRILVLGTNSGSIFCFDLIGDCTSVHRAEYRARYCGGGGSESNNGHPVRFLDVSCTNSGIFLCSGNPDNLKIIRISNNNNIDGGGVQHPHGNNENYNTIVRTWQPYCRSLDNDSDGSLGEESNDVSSDEDDDERHNSSSNSDDTTNNHGLRDEES